MNWNENECITRQKNRDLRRNYGAHLHPQSDEKEENCHWNFEIMKKLLTSFGWSFLWGRDMKYDVGGSLNQW